MITVMIAVQQVPIVKFVATKGGIEVEGDLSLYNRLAVENTRMLKRYSQIDERVRTLGYCLKVFTKVQVRHKSIHTVIYEFIIK